MTGPNDWRRITKNDSLPHTCCPGTSDSDSCTVNSAKVYNDSCVDKLVSFFKKYGSIIGGIGLGIAGAQVSIDIISLCSLYVIYQSSSTRDRSKWQLLFFGNLIL